MRRFVQIAILSLLVAAIGSASAAGLSRKQRKQLDEIQIAYAGSIRWVGFDDAIAYLDPAYRKEHPFSEFQMSRYQQVQVSSYRERGSSTLPNGIVERRVEIGIINRNTQSERVVMTVERWRWDPEAKRWWQTAGLPDLWQGQ